MNFYPSFIIFYKAPTNKTFCSDRDTCILTECENVTDEALDLSLKYNFVTQLTSMVVTKPDTNDTSIDTLIADKLTEGTNEMPLLNRTLKLKLKNSALFISIFICIHLQCTTCQTVIMFSHLNTQLMHILITQIQESIRVSQRYN